MKLLFTGASGFLGNNVRPLLERMYDVVLHAAGKAHSISKTEAEKEVFW